MTTVGLCFKGMKDTPFLPSNQSSGLAKALLELDASPAGNDEEFLDFQFKVADAKAREREASEQRSGWRAAFANLQLRQAQEIAEFALNQRKEDEARVAQQMAEIDELRSSLQARELELERVRAENASLLEHGSRLEKEFEQELRYSESLRQSVNELNHVQERMAFENSELKRALDEATVTTGRLKEALEEKASELSAWLGMDGINLPAMPSSILGEKFSLKADGKKTYSVRGDDDNRPQTSDKRSVRMPQDANECTNSSRVIEETANSFQSGAASSNTSVDEESIDMKHEVARDALPRSRELTTGSSNNSSPGRKGVSVRELLAEEREPSGHELCTRKEERMLVLEQKIQELQLELDGLRSQQHQSQDEIEQWVSQQRCCSTLIEAAKDDAESEGRLSNDSSSTTEKAEITVSSQQGSCSRDEAGTSADHAKRSSVELELDSAVPSSLVLSTSDGPGGSQGSPSRYEPGEVIWVNSRADLEDKHICSNATELWSLDFVSELVESITEELTKLLRVVIKTPSSSSLRESFNVLERRVKDWSNITSKALQSKVSKTGALEEWKDLVVDFLSKSRQELMTLQQRLHDCEDELSSVDKLRAESLVSTQTITFLKDEINKLEAQTFNDHIEREEEFNLLKNDLDHAHTLIAAAQRKTAEEHMFAVSVKEQLRKVELELEHSKQGWAAEQDFIDSCFGGEGGGLFGEEKSHSRKDMENLEKKVEELTSRLEENERELGELMVISGIDLDAVVAAKFKRMEQRLEDAKALEAVAKAEKLELASQVTWLKAKLAEVEHELHLENQQHVESLIRYEEEQGQLEAATLSERATLNAKLAHLEKLLAEKSKQLEAAHHMCTKVFGFRANVLGFDTSLAPERQRGVGSEAHWSKETGSSALLETQLADLESSVASLKTELSEAEQREKRAQSQIEKLMLELGIAKEEVLKCEVRMQKIIRQAKEDLDVEKRRLEESQNSQKQMEWHLCRQIELTEGLEREKAKLREVLEEFEIQNLALEKERDDLRTAYMQLARQTAQRVGFMCGLFLLKPTGIF